MRSLVVGSRDSEDERSRRRTPPTKASDHHDGGALDQLQPGQPDDRAAHRGIGPGDEGASRPPAPAAPPWSGAAAPPAARSRRPRAAGRSPAAFRLVHVVGGRLLEQLDGVDDPLTVGHRVPLHDERDDEVHPDEGAVDDRGDRLVEVVVVAGDELAHLVDEQPEADPGEHGRDVPRGAAEEQHEHQLGDEHRQPAPEQVREVQRAAAQLREAGGGQEHPGQRDRQHRADQEDLEAVRTLGIADRQARAGGHLPMMARRGPYPWARADRPPHPLHRERRHRARRRSWCARRRAPASTWWP